MSGKTILFVILIVMTAAAGGIAAVLTGGAAADESEDLKPNLVIDGEDPWVSTVFEIDDVTPGDSGQVVIEVENGGDAGSGDMLQLRLLNLSDEPGVTTEPEPCPDFGELSLNLDMLVWLDDGDETYEPGETKIAEDTLRAVAGVVYDLGPLPPGPPVYVGMAWSIDQTVGNVVHGDRCTFDIQFLIP